MKKQNKNIRNYLRGLNFKKLLNSNSLWAIILVFIKSAIGFFLVPYITRYVGIEAYGFVALANTMITYLDIVAISFNYFAQRYISVAYHQGDYTLSKKYYSSIIVANEILCIISIVPLLVFVLFLEHFIKISEYLVFDVKLLFGFVLLRYYISLFATPFENGSFLKDRYDVIAKNKVFSSIVQVFTIVCLFGFVDKKIYYVGIAAVAYDSCNFILQFAAKQKYTPLLKYNIEEFSVSSIKTFFAKGIWVSINNVGNLLNSGLDLLITNLMISETVMGQISVAKMISTMTYSFISGVSESFKAKQLKLYSEGKAELIDELKYAMKISGILYIAISGIIIACGENFIELWVKNQDVSTIYILMLICVFSDFIPSIMKPLYYVYTMTTKMLIPCIITISMGVLNVLSMYLLLKYTSLGGYAVVLTTMVINLIHLVDSPIYSAHCLHQKATIFYDVVLVYLISFMINGIICTLVSKIVSTGQSWFTLVFKMIIVGGIGGGIAFMIMTNKKEKKRIIQAIWM